MAVTDEGQDKIKPWVEKTKVTYPVVTAKDVAQVFAVAGYPTKYLIGPKFKVVAGDHFDVGGGPKIEELLKEVETLPQLDTSKDFDPVLKLLKSGDYAKAAVELEKLSKKEGKDGENAKALEKWVADEGEKRLAAGDEAKDAGEVFSARDIYLEVEKKWPPKAEVIKKAKDRTKALKEDKDAKKVLAQEKSWLEAQKAEAGKDNARAAALYAKCAKGAPGTKFAEKCEAKAKELGGK